MNTSSPAFDAGLLSRFLLRTKWFSRENQRVKQDAFMPPRLPNRLSLTKHAGLTREELWRLGLDVAELRKHDGCKLHGSADIHLREFESNGLRIVTDEPPRNHAVVEGWPEVYEDQKMIALQLAAKAILVLYPAV